MSTTLTASADTFVRLHHRRVRVAGGLTAAGAVAVAAWGASQNQTGELLVSATVVIVLITVLVWRIPMAGIVFFVFACTAVEQFPIVGDGTDRIPFFTSLNGIGVAGLYMSPAEILLALFGLAWLLKAGAERRLRFPTSPLGMAVAILMAVLAIALVRGLGRGGQFNVALNELRPWLYLALLYVLASQLVSRREALNAILWAFVLGTGLKGLQGTYEFLRTRQLQPRPDAILAHEEAFFFGLFILLVAALWLYGDSGRLRAFATGLLPAVIIADLGNSRRNAWLILVAGLAVLLLVTWIRLPARRPIVRRATLGLLALSVAYFPLFWNSQGALGQPARAIRSVIVPGPRDFSSNQYRQLEDANLVLNIQHSPLVGQGFGVPIDYAIPIPDLSSITSMIKFVPHDGILYLWLRLGIVGALAFWWLIGAAFIAAGRVIRHRDQRVALFGAVALCSLIAYLIQGYVDLGLYWFRIAIFMGCFLGAIEGFSRTEAEPGLARLGAAQ